ncbi:MAG TPA: hypothetical protein VFM27_19290 [Acidimicrobiales bacterium]|nr:hypothetical protein [Acidimicrobiales bacterium]
MNELRKPFLLVAIIMFALVVLVELGSSLVIGGGPADDGMSSQEAKMDITVNGEVDEPPGRAITYLALVDGILLYTVLLIGLSLLVPEKLLARAQGVLTLIGSIILIIVGIILVIIAFIELLVMVSLFFAFPFGTAAYLAVWGFFPRSDAAVLLSLLMFLKLAGCVFLVLAQQRFLLMKGLVLLILTSLVCNIIVAFLHGLVPIILVSIFDNIAALVVGIIAIIWAIVLLVLSIPSIVAMIRLGAGTDLRAPVGAVQPLDS